MTFDEKMSSLRVSIQVGGAWALARSGLAGAATSSRPSYVSRCLMDFR